ncbi:MAG TPA: alpha/beta fold hydrolase [Elusimicrobiota bacterium]|nr:alpha/beta fold hydrolase [Elusimicrobiota bacterium]
MTKLGRSICWLILAFSVTNPIWAGEKMTLTLRDGVQLVGDFTAPQNESAPVLVCLHGLGSHRVEWDPLVSAAHQRGWGVFSYDARGHGESVKTAQGGTISYQTPSYGQDPGFWRDMIGDLGEILFYLEKQRGVPAKRLIPVGASLGANVSLVTAVDHPKTPCLVLLSPGLEYVRIRTESSVSSFKKPILFVVSLGDSYAYQSVVKLSELTTRQTSWIRTGKGHGTQMFDGALEEKILDWIAKQTGWKSSQFR